MAPTATHYTPSSSGAKTTERPPLPQPNKDFHVSVIGAGIGGACMALGLLRAGVPVDVYESASHFSEIGAGISFGENAVAALEQLGLRQDWDRVFTGNPEGGQYFQWRLATGDDPELFAETMSKPHGNTTVHRAEFLDAVVQHIPKETAHFGKRLTGIEELRREGDAQASGRHLRLHFADGSTAETDVVIGCDGIHSATRRHLSVEKSGPAAKPGTEALVWSGTWAYRGLIPYDDYMQALGKDKGELLGGRTPLMFLAKDTHMLCFPIQHHDTVNVVAFATDRSQWPARAKLAESEPWTQKTTQEAMLSDFEGWGPDSRKILSLIQQPSKWALHTIHPQLKSYVNGRIVVAGDAAHGGTPHMGALAGQAIEDALFYSRLLAHPDINDGNVAQALGAVDAIRLPRGNRVMESSLHQGDVYEFADAEIGDDKSKLKPFLEHAWDWLWHFDHDDEWRRGCEWLKKEGIVKA